MIGEKRASDTTISRVMVKKEKGKKSAGSKRRENNANA